MNSEQRAPKTRAITTRDECRFIAREQHETKAVKQHSDVSCAFLLTSPPAAAAADDKDQLAEPSRAELRPEGEHKTSFIYIRQKKDLNSSRGIHRYNDVTASHTANTHRPFHFSRNNFPFFRQLFVHTTTKIPTKIYFPRDTRTQSHPPPKHLP